MDRKPTIRVSIADEWPLNGMDIESELNEIESVICRKVVETTYYLTGDLDSIDWAPDIIFISDKLLPFEGVKTGERLLTLCPCIKFIVYSTDRDDIGVLKWLSVPGVFDYVDRLPLWTTPSKLEIDLRAIYNTPFFDPAIYREKHWGLYKSKYPLDSFTHTELQFLRLNAKLPSLLDIGEAMALGRKAVFNLKESLYKKMEVMDRGDLGAIAIRMGLVQVEELGTVRFNV